jgi:hypothetical protein
MSRKMLLFKTMVRAGTLLALAILQRAIWALNLTSHVDPL